MATVLRQKTRLLLLVGLSLVAVAGKYLFEHSSAPRSTNSRLPPAEPDSHQRTPQPPPTPVQPPPGLPESPEVKNDEGEKKPPVVLEPAPALQITRATPTASEPTVTEGQSLSFAVEAEGGTGKALQYRWLLDGQEKAKGKKWTYQPDFTEGGDAPKQVTALVTDEAHQKAEKTWQVYVLNKDRPPRITSVSPHSEPIEVSPAEATDFSVTATDPDRDDRLLYIWTLNGQEVARGHNRRQFHAPPSASPYTVTVTVIDQDGQKDQMDWRVTVTSSSAAPRLVLLQPRENKVSTQVGQSLDFSVRAEVPGGAQKQLRYQWSVEGGSSTTTATGNRRFVFATPGIYRLTVFVVDSEGLQSAPKRWIVEVQK